MDKLKKCSLKDCQNPADKTGFCCREHALQRQRESLGGTCAELLDRHKRACQREHERERASEIVTGTETVTNLHLNGRAFDRINVARSKAS